MAGKKQPPKPGFTPMAELSAPTVPTPPVTALEPFEAKHPGGRPTKYRPEFCETVIQAGRDGFSLTAFAAMIEVDRSTIGEWVEQHAEFSLAVKAHKSHRTHKWEQRLGKIADEGGGNGSATATIFGLKNVAPEEWRDRVEHTGADGGPLEISWQMPAAAPLPGDTARDVTPAPVVLDAAPEPALASGGHVAVEWGAASSSVSGDAKSVSSGNAGASGAKPNPKRGEKP